LRRPYRLLPLVALSALALLTACKGGGSTSQAPGGFPPTNPTGDRSQWVGISDLGTSCANNNTTTSHISNWSLGSATVPLSGNLTPNDTWGNSATTKLAAPYFWFVDNNGNEWASNYGTGTGTNASVVETTIDKNGTTAPSRTITSASFKGPQGVYVGEANGVNNWVYVADATQEAIYIFPATASGASTPTYTITNTSATPFSNITGLVLDKSGNIWVDSEGNNSVQELSNPTGTTAGAYNETPIEIIAGSSTTLSDPDDVYLDAQSNIWVTNYGSNSITEFAPSSGGGTLNEAPVLTIAGGSTGLSGPLSVAVDNGGNVYAVNKNSGNPVIDIWWNNAIQPGTNNTAPTYTIGGSNTKLVCPAGIQVYSITGTNDV
jgi:hypothetical protein